MRKKAVDKTSPKQMALQKLVPNMMTLAALTAGMTSIQYAIDERWERAVIAIVIAAFIDAFDGAAARVLNATSRLGAELDTLSDFLCFGIAPATIMYLWLLQDAGRVGWIVAVVFAIATALRLARYNVEDKDENKNLVSEAKNSRFFTGVPAPTAGGMAILPLILSFQFYDVSAVNRFVTTPDFVAVWMSLFAILMVSRLPTFSSKQVQLPPKMVVPLLAIFGLMIAGLIHATWITLTLMGVVYGLSIPLAVFVAYRQTNTA
ncbi:MAG: CDP-alcohol phosphatidyltransferase family protein [Pseudomonadota bacterium]